MNISVRYCLSEIVQFLVEIFYELFQVVTRLTLYIFLIDSWIKKIHGISLGKLNK